MNMRLKQKPFVMRRIIRRGTKVYDPTNRLGSALVRAEEIQDRTLLAQVVVLVGGRAFLVDLRSRGMDGAVLVDERGLECVISGHAAMLLMGKQLTCTLSGKIRPVQAGKGKDIL